jgi:hypothetical protein
MDTTRRTALRRALRARYPWVADSDWGPATVEAGECDGCGGEARLFQTCGPDAGQYLGRRCLNELGSQALCDGHAAEARAALAWVGNLPAQADLVARVWWVATGEVALDPAVLEPLLGQLALTSPSGSMEPAC